MEVPNMKQNIPAVLSVMKFIYDNIMYAELNTKSDFCDVCGYDGEIQIKEDENGKLIWECPNCGNRNQKNLRIHRYPVLEPGTYPGDQGSCITSVISNGSRVFCELRLQNLI